LGEIAALLRQKKVSRVSNDNQVKQQQAIQIPLRTIDCFDTSSSRMNAFDGECAVHGAIVLMGVNGGAASAMDMKWLHLAGPDVL
jgi:hypothetical protein